MIKSKRKIILIVSVAILLIGLSLFSVLMLRNDKKDYIIRTGEKVDDLIFLDSQGNEIIAKDITNNTAFAFYVSNHCSPCLEKIPSIDIFRSIFNDEGVYNSFVIWRDKVPNSNYVSGFGDYSLKDVEISNSTPTFYIFKDSKVQFSTQDFDKFIAKSIKEIGSDDAVRLFQNSYNPERSFIFVFIATGCEENDELYSLTNGRQDIIYISSDSSLVREETNDIYDPQGVISQLLGVSIYPSILDSNSKLWDYEDAVGYII